MSLLDLLTSRGYTFRQHLEEVSWTERKLTVADLDEVQQAALEKDGIDGLKRKLAEQGCWPFPAVDITRPLPVRAGVALARGGKPAAVVVAPPQGHHLHAHACRFVDALAERFSVRWPLLTEQDATLALLQDHDVVLFGGAHQNRFAMDMAMRYQTGFVDAVVPGDDGWAATTHVGLDASGHNVVQIAAPPEKSADVLDAMFGNIVAKGESVVLRRMHCISPGRTMCEHFPSWETFADSLPEGVIQLADDRGPTPHAPVALADMLSKGLHSGGREVNWVNNRPIDIAILAAQYYQCSADARALRLFRELLLRLADYYLKTPEGASIPSDLDFRLGHLILYFARLEHEPVFSDDDRLILANLLLSCTRSIYEYTLKCWPIEPNEPTRHNHETFAARSLLFAADYFERYGIEDVRAWRERVEAVFASDLWNRFKQKENANFYEQFAFEHGAEYSAFTGRGLDLFDLDCLRQAARRQVATADNFFRPVDYGDAGVHMRNCQTDVLPILISTVHGDPTLQWYAAEAFRRAHHYFRPSPIYGAPGIRRMRPGAEPAPRRWEFVPLDLRFVELHGAKLPAEFAFDKLAFRTGWAEDDHYLLLEGVSNAAVSHSHNEVNGIVRLNHLGRHWVVSNGYGRRAGVTNVSQSFSTRVRGPEDHNMLVLRRGGQIVRDLPFGALLVQKGQTGDIAYATSALLGYAGTNWFRTLTVLADRFVLVVDRVQVVEPGLESAHIEWNCLGQARPIDRGWRLAQRGVFMDVTSDSGWAIRLDVADRSADWQRVLESGEYPFATFPLAKLIFEMPATHVGSCCTATLLAATRDEEPAFRIRATAHGCFRIEGPHGQDAALRVDDADLSIRADESALEIHVGESPPSVQAPEKT